MFVLQHILGPGNFSLQKNGGFELQVIFVEKDCGHLRGPPPPNGTRLPGNSRPLKNTKRFMNHHDPTKIPS